MSLPPELADFVAAFARAKARSDAKARQQQVPHANDPLRPLQLRSAEREVGG